VEQAERELAEAGFDVAAERARAEAFLRALEDGTYDTSPSPKARAAAQEPVEAKDAGADAAEVAKAAVTPARRKTRPTAVWVAAALAAAAAAVAYVETHPDLAPIARTPPPPPTATATASAGPSPEVLAVAADLRRRAAEACDVGREDVCLALLDEAAKKDPAGDATPEVVRLRERASDAIQAKPR
jgi:hypothetical protein